MKNIPKEAIKGKPGVEGFGERLSCVRRMRRMTQEALAVKAQSRSNYISRYERGFSLPDVTSLRALCLALNVSADYLIDSHDS